MRNDGRNALNGRCQKDALDRAEDICELCGHQFCANCLLFPRGHRSAPTCKTCALEHSGIRGSSSKGQAISKREYKKRKKELLAQLEDVAEKQPAIEFFELKDPSQFDPSTELDRRQVAIEEEPTIDILASSNEAPPLIPPAPQAAPPPPATSPPSAEPFADDHARPRLAPVDTSVNPLALGDFPPQTALPEPVDSSNATSSAAELLARLKADQPIQSQFNSTHVGLDTDPFASPTSDLVARRPATDGPVPAALVTPAPVAPPSVAPTPAAPAPVAPAATRRTSEPWSPPTPPPRGSNLDSIGNDQTVTDSPAPHTAFEASAFETSPFGQGPSPVNPTDERNLKRRKADTDDSGQWIPPSLRGMSVSDEQDPLPKRRN